MKRILVIGSANADQFIRTGRMPRLGETVVGSGLTMTAGGKGLNQAVAIAKLGGVVSFLGAVGNDANGDLLLRTLEEQGIPFEGIRTDGISGSAFVTIVGHDNFIMINPGANALLTPEVIEKKRDLITDADCVVLQLEIPLESVIRAAELAKESGTRVVLNPAPYQALPEKLLALADILVPNESEAEGLTGIRLTDQAACASAVKRLRGNGEKTVIITLGERGCVYNCGKETVFCPAEKVDTVDTTSAGDSFIGALCVKLAIGSSLQEAIGFANRVSAITVSRSGAACSIPRIEELDF